jgi:ATP-dependent DNA helicase RecG
MVSLDTDIRYIKGVGETRAKAFEKLGIYTLRDLVRNFPRAYDDRTVIKKIADLIDGETVCISATVATMPTLSHIRKGLDIVKLRAVDENSTINITFFNQSYVRDQLTPGESFIFYGKVSGTPGRFEMTNPIFERENSAGNVTGKLVPIYHSTAGLYQSAIQKAVRQGLDDCGEILPDALPRRIQAEYKLSQARFAYENIHFPKDYESLDIARTRLIFEEFFVLSCALDIFHKSRTVKLGYGMEKQDLSEFCKYLPFTLTGAQTRAIEDAFNDMSKNVPMSRLIQGDVGSGKTAVAAACCWNAVKNGYQAAFMAPTEILAEQHYATLSSMLEPFGIKTALLTSGLGAKAKREVLGKIKSGDAEVVIGTHALISKDVVYCNLGLVVADEQHRFGVQQRAALTEKGESPHVLVMSATPIPRTLALIVYGDLDVSILDELPPGRQKVDTFAVDESMRKRIYAFIRKQVEASHQVFIVCPAVEESEEQPDGLKSVREYTKELSEVIFPDLKVALVHGKMKPKEKNEVMTEFAGGNINILVATTVIEVGVDVPNATLMVVENADRFGLSQLHQLRGRVGRGKDKSYCVLFEGAGGEKAKERLGVMCKTNDGFKIAEEDLKLRGPGDFFGSRQHGLPEMHIANFATDVNLLKSAQEAAKSVIEQDPELKMSENSQLKDSVMRMIQNSDGTLN